MIVGEVIQLKVTDESVLDEAAAGDLEASCLNEIRIANDRSTKVARCDIDIRLIPSGV